MPITPPKCKTCGRIEWRHVCLGPAPTLTQVRAATAALERASTVVKPYTGADTIDHHVKQVVAIMQAPKPARLKVARKALASVKTKPRKRTKRKRMPKDKAAPPADGEPPKRPRGRPRTIENLKAYKAEKERKRRARLRENK